MVDLVSWVCHSGTQGVYSSHWSCWFPWSWCNQRDLCKPSRIQVANSLAFLSTGLTLRTAFSWLLPPAEDEVRLRISLQGTLLPSSPSDPLPPFSALMTDTVPFAQLGPWEFAGGGPTPFRQLVTAYSSGTRYVRRTSEGQACLSGWPKWFRHPLPVRFPTCWVWCPGLMRSTLEHPLWPLPILGASVMFWRLPTGGPQEPLSNFTYVSCLTWGTTVPLV